MKKLEEHAATMPETAGEQSQLLPSLGSPGQTELGQENLVNTAAGAAGGLAGWAFSSLGMKLAASDLQSTIASQSNMTLPNIPGSMPPTPVPDFDHMNPPPSEVGGSKPKGMQLGGHVSSTLSHAAEWAAEAEVGTSNPWGNDDLMDVNADQDDWSAFEAAPVLGHETYDKQPVKAPAPAETTPRRMITPLKQTVPSRSPTITPPAPQQVMTNTAQTSLSNMTKEEKVAEINRRKEERKQRIAQLKAQKASNGKAGNVFIVSRLEDPFTG